MSEIQICHDPKFFAQSLCSLRNSHVGFKAQVPIEILSQMVASPLPAKKRFFIAQVGPQVVATMGANISLEKSQRGYIGFFEVHPDHHQCFSKLLASAMRFLHEEGATEIYAPVNYSTWFSYRFQEPSHDDNRFSWEPQNPPIYLKLFSEAGFQEASRYATVGMESLAEFAAAFKPSLTRALDAGYKICAFPERGGLEEILKELYVLSMDGFEENYLFEKLPFEMFRAIYVPIFHKGDLSLANFAINREGQAVAFNFSFADGPNYVCKSLGVALQARGQGLSNAMVAWSAAKALERGLKHAVTALVRSGIQSESYAKKARNSWRHEYILLRS